MLLDEIKSLPKNPGVYLYKNSDGIIIYVGKAKNLKNRVSSYFNSSHQTSSKTRVLVKNIKSIDYIIVDNEVEALLLENKLIKKYSPKYNISLKDDKTYAYIKITDDEIPFIITTRKINKNGSYYGPFVDGYARKILFELTIKLFGLVSNRTYSTKSRLNYDLGIAPAPTLKEVDKLEYLRKVNDAKEFLEGKNINKIKKKLQSDMELASANLNYELAIEIKKQIDALDYLNEKQKVDLIKDYDQQVIALVCDENKSISFIQVFKVSKGVISGKKEFKFDYYEEDILEEFIKMYYSKNYIPREILINLDIFQVENDKQVIEDYLSRIRGSKVEVIYPKKGEKKRLVELVEKNAIINLSQDVLDEMKRLLYLPKKPNIIECFDMSNLGSDYLVGGMVRFVNGKRDKDMSRKFEIKSFKGKNDDFESMREVIYRRYKREFGAMHERWGLPDLIIIDGGKGQLNAALDSLNKLRLKIPIVSLAKKEEEIFHIDFEDSLKYKKDSKMMLFIRSIRDSVHNYVVSYNREKRSMKIRNELEKK